MKYIKLFEHFGINYDYVIGILTSKEYGWGNVIVNEIKEFEKNNTLPSSDDDYIVQFNHWLYKKFKNNRTLFRDDLIVKSPRSWYAKST